MKVKKARRYNSVMEMLEGEGVSIEVQARVRELIDHNRLMRENVSQHLRVAAEMIALGTLDLDGLAGRIDDIVKAWKED